MRATRSVLDQIEQAFGFCHASRLRSVMAGVEALLSGAHATLTSIGRAVDSTASEKHCIKRIDRLLGNERLYGETLGFCRALARSFLPRSKAPVVLIDWTDLGSDVVALRAGVGFDGRALPLWFVLVRKWRLGDPEVQRRFLGQLKQILPEGCRPLVITDAGFQGPWFRAVQELGWDFLGRLNTSLLLRPLGGDWVSPQQLSRGATATPRSLGRHQLVRKGKSYYGRVITVHKPKKPRRRTKNRKKSGSSPAKAIKRANTPMLLVTSLPSKTTAKKVLRLYELRMQIEQTFRDDKNSRWGFGLEHARSRTIKRKTVLLLLVTIATVVLFVVGLAAETAGLRRRFQANTSTRRCLSLLTLGLRVLRRGWPPQVPKVPPFSIAALRHTLATAPS